MSKHPSELRVCFSFVANVCAKIVMCVVPRACAKDCGIAAHTCCGIAASRNQLAALPRDRKYVGRVAACSGIAATHTTCTHVRGDASFTPLECQTTYTWRALKARRRDAERARACRGSPLKSLGPAAHACSQRRQVWRGIPSTPRARESRRR